MNERTAMRYLVLYGDDVASGDVEQLLLSIMIVRKWVADIEQQVNCDAGHEDDESLFDDENSDFSYFPRFEWGQHD